MNIKKTLSLFSFLIVFFLIGASCSNPKTSENPREVMNKMKAEMTKQLSFNFTAEMNLQEGLNIPSALGQSENYNKLILTGKSNRTISKSETKQTITMSGKSGTRKLEVIQIGSDMYIKPIEGKGSALLGDKWLKMSMSNKNKEINTQQSKKIKEIIKKNKLLEVVQDKGLEKISGKTAYHYVVKPNKQGINKVQTKITKINKKYSNQNKFLSKISEMPDSSKIDLWIGAEDYRIYRIKGENMKINSKTAGIKSKTQEITANIDIQITEYGVSTQIDKPSNESITSIEEMTSGFFGGNNDSLLENFKNKSDSVDSFLKNNKEGGKNLQKQMQKAKEQLEKGNINLENIKNKF
ncbi:MAG: hypothetical protein ABEJ24_00555 [Candidatus Magasanikbacteria bacterium]